jgi:hypothetical protein
MMIDLKGLQEKAEKASIMSSDYENGEGTWDNGIWSSYLKESSPDVVLSLCSELSAARDSKWISAIDRLPGDYIYCLVLAKGEVAEGFMFLTTPSQKSCWKLTRNLGELLDSKTVTHWQPLPAPPTELLESEKAAK